MSFAAKLLTIESLLQCDLCHQLLRSTRVLTECGHRFCELCVTDRVGEDRCCPKCKLPAIIKNVRRDPRHDVLVACVRALKRKLVTDPLTPLSFEQPSVGSQTFKLPDAASFRSHVQQASLATDASRSKANEADEADDTSDETAKRTPETVQNAQVPSNPPERTYMSASAAREALDHSSQNSQNSYDDGALLLAMLDSEGVPEDADAHNTNIRDEPIPATLSKNSTHTLSNGTNPLSRGIPSLQQNEPGDPGDQTESAVIHTAIRMPVDAGNEDKDEDEDEGVNQSKSESESGNEDEDDSIQNPISASQPPHSYNDVYGSLHSVDDTNTIESSAGTENEPDENTNDNPIWDPFFYIPRKPSSQRHLTSARDAQKRRRLMNRPPSASWLCPFCQFKNDVCNERCAVCRKNREDHAKADMPRHVEATLLPTMDTYSLPASVPTPEWEEDMTPDLYPVHVLFTHVDEALRNETEAASIESSLTIHFHDSVRDIDVITHVITTTDENGLAKRTGKYLHGIVAGKWIVDNQWLLKSLQSNRWLPEAPYEAKGDMTLGPTEGPKKGRLRRTKSDPALFEGVRFFFVGDFSPKYQKQELLHLCQAAGGIILNRRPTKQQSDTRVIVPSLEEPSDQRAIQFLQHCQVHGVVWMLGHLSRCEPLTSR